MQEVKQPSLGAKLFKRYGLDALSAMALGLFSTLIIGTIIEQLGSLIPPLSILSEFAATAKSGTVVGAAIGVSVAWGTKVAPLAIFTSAVTGAIGYTMGGPLGSFIAAVPGAEAGNWIAGKTKLDIILVPTATIVVGGLVAVIVGPGVNWIMAQLRNFIDMATLLQPIPMGIILSVVVGLVLTAPISSAALCAMIFSVPEGGQLGLGLQLAAGAATVGCCAQMVGFAVASYRENGISGLIAQGVGTSMLQVPNILRHPLILVPPTLTSAILGPLSTTIFDMRNTGVFAGMGTSGFVGQIGTWKAMAAAQGGSIVALKMMALHIVLPALLSLIISEFMRKRKWIHEGDMKLKL